MITENKTNLGFKYEEQTTNQLIQSFTLDSNRRWRALLNVMGREWICFLLGMRHLFLTYVEQNQTNYEMAT